MAFLAGVTLVWRGTALDRMWALNPRAYNELAPFGKTVGILFLLLAVTLVVASVGWFKRCVWGWKLGVAIIATQLLGDSVNLFLGRIVEGVMGLAIAGALFFYMLRRRTRAAFDYQGPQGSILT
jgi:mannose/fructose/N-acetylgalactosamine-specific phosphotransferase system component IID